MARVEEQGIGQPVVLDVPLAPVPSVETGERLTTETTTRQTPQGTVETQIVEQRQVQTAHVGFFEESTEVFSIMRLLAFMLVVSGIGIAYLGVILDRSLASTPLAMSLVTAGVGGKIWQRKLEDRGPLKE